MTDRSALPANAIVIPGPSVHSEGLARAVASTTRRVLATLMGAADALRTLRP